MIRRYRHTRPDVEIQMGPRSGVEVTRVGHRGSKGNVGPTSDMVFP